ncbi:MAG: hypothetical protein AAF577_06860 [Pseudomonadota bacterium]
MEETAGDAIALRHRRIDEIVTGHLGRETPDREGFRNELRTIKSGLSNYSDDELRALVENLRDQATEFEEMAKLPTKSAAHFTTQKGLGLGLSGVGAAVALLSVSGVGGFGLIACGLIIAGMSRSECDKLQDEAMFYTDVARDFRDVADEIGARHVD